MQVVIGFKCCSYLLTTALNKRARALGAQQKIASATKIVTEDVGSGQRVVGVQIEASDGSVQILPAATVVNCAGPWAGALARTHDMDLPVVPRRRYVYQV